MNKTCARCEKTVYPIEELKCLDKVWHKPCFKCQGCGMTLNLRTYKGFNKQPYCEAHIPKAKATTMAETPELKRIAENTKIQSNVKYHEDFEKSKGKFTQVADDPETLRIKQNSKIISNVAYHGELEKKAAMEQKRATNDNGDYVDDYEGASSNGVNHNNNHYQSASVPKHEYLSESDVLYHHDPPQSYHTQPISYQQQQQHKQLPPAQQYATHHQQQMDNYATSRASQPRNNNNSSSNSNRSSHASRHTNSSTLIYTSDLGAVNMGNEKHIGSVLDMDPVNHVYNSSALNDYHVPQPQQQQQYQHHQQQQYQQHAQQQQQQQQQQRVQTKQTRANPNYSGRLYRALYDYEAQDSDEVSFMEGDYIIQETTIDAGWMTGTVQRTNGTGMLPANYVERVTI